MQSLFLTLVKWSCSTVQHTSASLTINENYDSDVQADTETFLSRIVPEVIYLFCFCSWRENTCTLIHVFVFIMIRVHLLHGGTLWKVSSLTTDVVGLQRSLLPLFVSNYFERQSNNYNLNISIFRNLFHPAIIALE
jgi:hypothetical protein